MDVLEVINKLNSKISSSFSDFKGCYLYGSRARGDNKENSDIDIVALFDEIDRDKELEVADITCDLDYEYDVFLEVHLYTLDELKSI